MILKIIIHRTCCSLVSSGRFAATLLSDAGDDDVEDDALAVLAILAGWEKDLAVDRGVDCPEEDIFVCLFYIFKT